MELSENGRYRCLCKASDNMAYNTWYDYAELISLGVSGRVSESTLANGDPYFIVYGYNQDLKDIIANKMQFQKYLRNDKLKLL